MESVPSCKKDSIHSLNLYSVESPDEKKGENPETCISECGYYIHSDLYLSIFVSINVYKCIWESTLNG